jgi:hypothetical protein
VEGSVRLVPASRVFWVDDFCAGPLLLGDFDGDGRTDVSCRLVGSDLIMVGLSSGGGFSFSNFGHAWCDTAEATGTLDLERRALFVDPAVHLASV